jgi:glycosyltransferase involved in cell wall biosynthesis
MINVLLIHHDKVPLPLYRVKNYRYLYSYLQQYGYDLQVCTDDAITYDSPGFPLAFAKIGLSSLIQRVETIRPQVCILVVNHSRSYFFPFLSYLRARGVKVITWTHATDLQQVSRVSSLVHHVEHQLCDGIVIYAEHMRKYLLERHHKKSFVANNTLNLTEYCPRNDRASVFAKHGIDTARNVIFVGRVQARKRVHDLLAAFSHLALNDCGLIIIGSDDEGILKRAAMVQPRIFWLGPLYGDDVLDLLTCADVYCIPGAIGLSIVDAMFCGLPVVTEQVAHGPEIMYLHHGENGFIVPKGDVAALADKLFLLVTNRQLRQQFSDRARQEIATKGHINELCRGVLECLDYVAPSAEISRGAYERPPANPPHR